MKTLLNLILLLCLSTLVSCGAKKAGITLSVSNSMAITNSSFQGGLIFFGRSTTGKIFSAPVAYGAGSGNQIQIELDKGEWTFGAVGWNGAGVFEGIAKCAMLTTKLDSSEQTVNLDMNSADCSLSDFGGNISVTQGYFKALQLVTCGTLYNNTTTKTVLSTDNTSFCSGNTAVAPDFKIHAKSVQISIPVLVPGQIISGSPLSTCIDLDSDGVNVVSPKALPAKGIPLSIELFDTSCADVNKKMITKYYMQEGLAYAYTGFDHQYYPGVASPATPSTLYLLASISRRGTSSLMGSLPSFKCDTLNPCIKLPTSTNNRYIRPGRQFYVKDATGTDDCANLNATTDVSITNPSPVTTSITTFDEVNDCENRDGKIYVRLQQSYLTTASCTAGANCSVSFAFDSGSLALTFKTEVPGVSSLDAYDFILRSIGHQDVVSAPFGAGSALNGYNSLDLFNSEDGEEDKHFGILGKIREMLRPDTLGGLLASFTTFSTLTGTNLNFSFWDKGIQRSYNLKVEAEPSTAYIPMYMYANTDASTTTVNTARPFTHKMTLSRIAGGAQIPEHIFRFDYGTQVGMSESKDIEIDTVKNELRTNRRLLFWNTAVMDHGRFESYNYQKVVQNSNNANIISYETSFTRAERENTSIEYNTRIDEFSFKSEKKGLGFDQTANKKLAILKDGKAIYSQSSAQETGAANPLTYFTQDFFSDFNKSAAVSANTAYARSPNNEKMIMAWPQYNGATWDLKVVRQTVGSGKVINTITIGSQEEIIPKVSTNNGGEATVAWTKKTSGPTWGVYAIAWNGSNWKEADGSTATIAGTVISLSGGALDTYSSSLKIDIVDADPSSNGSTKALVYSHFSSIWYIKIKTYAGGTWSTQTSITPSAEPLDLKIVKANASDYYITYIYNSAGYNVMVRKTDFSTSIEDNEPITSSVGKLITTFNPSNNDLNVYVIDFSNQANNESSVYDESAPDLANFSSLSDANFQFNFNQGNYCFNRSTTSAFSVGTSNLTLNSACVVPDTSFALPIKRSTSSPAFNGYNNDIKGLNPATFVNLFSM